jgi:hypothetical protein
MEIHAGAKQQVARHLWEALTGGFAYSIPLLDSESLFPASSLYLYVPSPRPSLFSPHPAPPPCRTLLDLVLSSSASLPYIAASQSLDPLIPPMVGAKSVPKNRRLSSNGDPFDAVLRPPPDETPAQREMRILAEQQAKQVSDAIDEQLRVERAELKRNRPDVKILLLGQSESGKSTTLKRRWSAIILPFGRELGACSSDVRAPPRRLCLQAYIHLTSCAYSHAHSFRRVPASPYPRCVSGRANSVAHRYLPQSRPLCPKVRLFLSHHTSCTDKQLTANRILDTISAEREEDTLDNASIISDRHTASSVPTTDSETHRISAEKHAEYSALLAPVLELEGRLIRRLREDDDEDEATHLGDGSTPGWSTPRGEYAVRTTSNWKRAFSIRRSRAKRSTSTSWGDDPADPVHVLDGSRDAMLRLWGDEWVRRRLVEKRVRLQESSGLCVRTLSYAHRLTLN